jgi:mannose-1-phosphate guanylyltransferase
MINIILSGGSGTRLWPISRKKLPKQFIKFFNGKSLFQETVVRNSSLCEKYLIVSNAEQAFLVQDDLNELQAEQKRFRYLFESVGRNTAPAIAMASMLCDSDDILLVTPSDHLIRDYDKYAESVKLAEKEAKNGFIVTFGIKPGYPETGYGYIEADGYDVVSFKEKPDSKTAKEYIEKGNYLWNSGIFCFKAGVMLEEMRKHCPLIYASCREALNASGESNKLTISPGSMKAIPAESIDYAVMEKSSLIRVIPSNFSWSDLGSFEALYSSFEKDEEGNAFFPENSNTPVTLNSSDNLFITSKRKIAAIDVEDLLIADMPDALLIAKKGSSQKVRLVVGELEKQQTTTSITEVSDFSRRPWGNFTVLEERAGYKIKQITVKPGKRLSLQKHFHRSEHWVVVSGTASVTIGEKELTVSANESTYISQGQVHRLENRGTEDLVIVEVQVGDYTGEDDIIRLSDDHGRG